jgi:hypothetical protein
LLALGVADLLQDDLLGRLRTDPADRDGLDLLFDVVVDFDVRDLLERLEVEDLGVGQLQAGVIRDDVPAAEGFVFARFAVDRDADVDFAALQLLRRRGERRLDRLENDLEVDAFLARDRVHQHQQFTVHWVRPPSASSLARAPSPGAAEGANRRPLKSITGTSRASRTSSRVKLSTFSSPGASAGAAAGATGRGGARLRRAAGGVLLRRGHGRRRRQDEAPAGLGGPSARRGSVFCP